MHAAPPTLLIPESAPFSPDQRAWLSGYFAALLSPEALRRDAALAGRRSGARRAMRLPDPRSPMPTTRPGTIPALASNERLKMAESRPLAPRLMAAMAQQDCGQCGYNCADYANALFLKKEERLNLCAPGGKETLRALKKLAEELDAAPAEAKPAAPAVVSDAAGGRWRNALPGARARIRRKAPSCRAAGSTRRTPRRRPGTSRSTSAASGLDYEVGDSLGVFAANHAGPRRRGDRPARRAAGAPDRRAHAARASPAQGRSRRGARRAVPAPLLRHRRRAAPESPGARGGRGSGRRRRRRSTCSARCRSSGGAARRRSLRRGARAAAAAALLDLLLAQGRSPAGWR